MFFVDATWKLRFGHRNRFRALDRINYDEWVTHEGFWRKVETETPTAGENRMDSFEGFLNKET